MWPCCSRLKTSPTPSLSLQVHPEAQEIVRTFWYPDSPVEVQVHPHPDADDFREMASSFEQKKVAVVHISGHTTNGEVPVLYVL